MYWSMCRCSKVYTMENVQHCYYKEVWELSIDGECHIVTQEMSIEITFDQWLFVLYIPSLFFVNIKIVLNHVHWVF